MELANIALKQILTMFVIVGIGVITYKKKIIDAETNKKLSNIILLIVNPLVIFTSYQTEFNKDLLYGLLWSLLLGTIGFVLTIVLSHIMIRGKDENIIPIERISLVYSNCGFIGIPLISALFGKEGVFYLTAYLTVFNLLLWTHGVILMTGKTTLKATFKAMLTPSIFAVFFGIILFLLNYRLPGPILSGLESIASMNTPIAMLVAGITIAQTNILKILSKWRIYYVTFLKLIFIPVLLVFVYSLFHNLSDTVIYTSLIAAACPAGASGTLFALRYGRNSVYASEVFAFTTLLSAVTIPVVILIAGYLI